MHQLQHVADLIAQAPELKEAIKKAAIAGIEDYTQRKEIKYCDICDKKLSIQEINSITPIDFLIVCGDHRQYANHFQIDIVRKRLGIPERSAGIIEQIKAL